jgi:hypothetical protein
VEKADSTDKSVANPIQSWTMSPAHDPVRDLNNSPAKAGLVLKLSSSTKGRVEQRKKKRKKNRAKKHKFTERRREKGGATQRQELALLLSSSLQKKKNPKSIKKKLRESRHIHYLLSSFILRTEKTKEERTVRTARR